MNERIKTQSYFLYFTLPITLLMVVCSGVGILKPDFYKKETADWLAQCVGQDLSNVLFIVPVLIVTSILSSRGSRTARIIWAGAMITNIYSYILYCFDVHFNGLFHFYCMILGLSVYSFLYFCAKHFSIDFKAWFKPTTPGKAVGIFLLVIAAAFYFLWLSQSLPAVISGNVPAAVSGDALPTNPVHVLDFSFFLPLVVIAGVLVLRKERLGYFLAPMMLVFGLITNVNIISLTLVTMAKSNTNELGLVCAFTIFSFIDLFFITFYLKNVI